MSGLVKCHECGGWATRSCTHGTTSPKAQRAVTQAKRRPRTQTVNGVTKYRRGSSGRAYQLERCDECLDRKLPEALVEGRCPGCRTAAAQRLASRYFRDG